MYTHTLKCDNCNAPKEIKDSLGCNGDRLHNAFENLKCEFLKGCLIEYKPKYQCRFADLIDHHTEKECVICNSELDEKGAGGIWDLSGEICDVLMLDNEHEEQDTIYNIIREYIENQNYCCNCGNKNKE